MIPIVQFNEFKLYQPEPEFIPAGQAAMLEKQRENNRFLRAHVPGKHLNITGSFIYAHPPDYIGEPTLHWTTEDWERLFRRFASLSLDTVILQASAWKELEECYYPSKVLRSMKQWNVVDPMLEAARNTNLKVFLGGMGSIVGWNPDPGKAKEEIDLQTSCMKELLGRRELFDGIYFSPETAFRGKRDPLRENVLNMIYRKYFSTLKESAPEKKIMISPASVWYPEMEEDFCESWEALLKDVPLDIIAPQDSIGCGGCSLENQSAMWALWEKTISGKGIELWANIELFERVHFGGETPFVSASPERISAQLENVSPHVGKCVCWEYAWFEYPILKKEESR